MKPITDEEILNKLDSWTLSCAVGAENGSIYGAVGSRGAIDLERWLRLVNTEKWDSLTGGIGHSRVRSALRNFAKANSSRHMNEVDADENRQRNLAPSLILGPGESITLECSITRYRGPQ